MRKTEAEKKKNVTVKVHPLIIEKLKGLTAQRKAGEEAESQGALIERLLAEHFKIDLPESDPFK